MLHYRKIEEPKTDLIILHGLLGMSDNWGVLGKRYAQTYRVHLLDLPNHGQSPHQQNMSFESMAQDIIQYLDSENIKKCLIIGHSLGGKVAITLSFLYPERFYKVIVVDICQRAYQPSMLDLLNLLHSTDLKKFEDRSDIHQYLLEKLEDRELVGFVGKNIERQKDNTFKWKANLPVILANYPKMISTHQNGTSSIQTLFLYGENSPYISSEDFPIIKSQFTNAQIMSVSESGHWVQADNPEEFYTKSMLFFLQNNLQS